MKFEQKAFGEKRSFVIGEHGIQCRIKKGREETEGFVPFENLLKERSRRIERIAPFVYSGCLFAALAVSILVLILSGYRLHFAVPLFPATLALVSFLLYQLTARQYISIGLADGAELVFLEDAPSARDLQEFVKEAFARRDLYLKDHYFYLDPRADPEREQRRLRWLIDQRVVTETELLIKRRDPSVLVERRVN